MVEVSQENKGEQFQDIKQGIIFLLRNKNAEYLTEIVNWIHYTIFIHQNTFKQNENETSILGKIWETFKF